MNANVQPNASEEKKRIVNLSDPGVAKALSKRILEDIDEYCATKYDDGHRKHLGASLIGHKCSRYLWYAFRWVKHVKHSGRQQRLFNRGHREEERFIEWLEGIGFKIWYENRDGFCYHPESDSYCILPPEEIEKNVEINCITPDSPYYREHVARAKADGLKFPQYKISACKGHFGGSLDGIARLPDRYCIDEPVLLEFKTNGTGAGFSALCNQGMPVAKPQHFAQTSTYGEDYKFNYVAYFNINKNDDDLHVEVVKLDHKLGEQMKLKAERIIFSDKAPEKLSLDATSFDCKYCDMNDICHKGAIPEKNCRSCKHASPIEDKQWFCSKHNGSIPDYVIKEGCDHYDAITNV